MSEVPVRQSIVPSTPMKWEAVSVLVALLFWVFILSVQIGAGLIAGLAVFSLTRFVRRSLDRLVQGVHDRASKRTN